MLDRVRISQRVLTQMAALGRRQMSKKTHKLKAKGEKPAKGPEGQEEINPSSSDLAHASTAKAATDAGPIASSAAAAASSAKPAVESSLSQSERAFIGVGALICGGIGYYAWNHRKASMPVDSKLSGESSVVLSTANQLRTDTSGVEHMPQSEVGSGSDVDGVQVSAEDNPSVNSSNENALVDPGTPNISGQEGDPALQLESATDEEAVTIDPTPVNELFGEALGLNSIGVKETNDDELNKGPLQGGSLETENSERDVVKDVPAPLRAQRSLEEHLEYSEEVGIITQALINEAITSRDAPWSSEEWKQVHQQAQSDALHFLNWKKHVQEKVQAETEAQRSKIEEVKAKLLKSETAKATYKEEMTKLMEEQETVLNNLKEKELEKQAAFLAVAASEAAVKERVERVKVLDEIRHKANALSAALKQRTQEAKLGHITNKVAEGVLALSMCLEHGLPCQNLVSALRSSCGDDSLLSAVLNSLSDEMNSKGVPTMLQLSNRYKEIKGDLLALGMLPNTGGGLLAQMVAKFGAWFKVSEPGHGGPSTVVSGLTCANTLLANGDVSLAADQVEKATSGTAAAVLAQKWVTNARNRAIAEQAVKVLQARATCLTVSLV